MSLMLCVLVALFIVERGTVDAISAARSRGQRIPSLERRRERHQHRGKPTKPKGPVRDYLGALSESAFGRAAEVARHKHQRRLAWYHETAPDRDEKWRDKQRRKLAKQDAAAERFANRAGIVWREKNPDTESKPVSPASVDHSDTESNETSPTPATSTNNTEENLMSTYDQAVDELHRSAEEIDRYRDELIVFVDGLRGRGWGQEVVGPLADMSQALSEAASAYRDQATDMQSQGDAVRDAYERHPYVPSKEAALA